MPVAELFGDFARPGGWGSLMDRNRPVLGLPPAAGFGRLCRRDRPARRDLEGGCCESVMGVNTLLIVALRELGGLGVAT